MLAGPQARPQLSLNHMDLDTKIGDAQALIERLMRSYRHPMVMSSFGKDSMVMLDIIKHMGLKLPVVFHREPFFQQKYQFAQRVICENDYAVYDYPPLATAVTKNGEHFEIVSFYQAGDPPNYTYVPTGIRTPENGKPFLCGLEDLYYKPTGTFEFPWDLGFVGHKSSDVDPILGPIPLYTDLKVNQNGCDYAFPLRHFTDVDVWEYSRRFDVPIHKERYDPENGFRERPDVTLNPDYHHACVLCMDRDGAPQVFCPKYQTEVPNVSARLRYVEPELPTYLAK